MKSVLNSAAVAVVAALTMPVVTAEEKKEKDPETLEKMIAAGSLTGKVVRFKESSKELKIQVEVGVAVPSSYHLTELAKSRLALANAARIRDPIRRQIS